ncbi:MAG: hypothetical protein JKY80_01955 [Mariprofundaceae bacterium]|nr:hypothetical protein [Methylophaga sp.]MBL4759604.1 hypothetical protein [Mariprofundaceae bacterium]
MEIKQLIDTLMIAIDSSLADLHTATIAKITAVNATTIDCQPVTSRVVNGAKIDLPEFVEVPVLFMQGGGSYTAYPIVIGDYCLLIFTERAFDRWYAGQDNQKPIEFRMHDYSDGIAIVGLNPLASAITIPSVIEHKGDSHHIGNMQIDGNITHTGTTQHTGDVTISGNLIVNGISFGTHVHGGVQTGGGSTGTPQ